MSRSNQKRSSPNPPQTDLKNRVTTCLNKLSDRDTLAVATTELESIAKTLTTDSFSPFLTCLSTTDSSEKSPVRRQCVRLIGLISAAHGDALSPHLTKMLSAVLRRLRDPDSAVRSACVEAVSLMASQITKPPFSSFLKPLVEFILHEQDYNSQIGSALCLAAAIEASPGSESVELRKLLPRLLKLVKSDCFKAKPAMLSLFGSIVSVGGASNQKVLSSLIPCLVEFLSSDDWAVRKAAAETLVRLALAERNLLPEFRSSCLATLDSRRFDKVKAVREMMNRALELWKELPGDSDEVLPQSQCKSSMKDTGVGGCSPTVSRSACDNGLETPQAKKTVPSSSSPSSDNSLANTTQKRSPIKCSYRKPSESMFCNVDSKKFSNCKIEIAAPQPSSLNLVCEDGPKSINFGVSDLTDSGTCSNLKPETKRVIFNKTSGDKLQKFGGLRFGSRVVPFHENDNYELDAPDDNATEEVYGNNREYEDLNLIREQLVQIEHQQSGLMDLLQRFIGSSQSGMSSLETRVNGLERTLDEMSHDFAISTGRISSTNSSGNTCCMLPGAGFLSPKFWRTEGQNSRFSFSGRNQSLTPTHGMPENSGTFKLYSPRKQHQNGSGSVGNPLADTCRDSRRSLEPYWNRTVKKSDSERVQACKAGGLDGDSLANYIKQ